MEIRALISYLHKMDTKAAGAGEVKLTNKVSMNKQ